MQEHKDVAGLRNKPFFHFDELTTIFSRNRATWEGAEALADTMKNIEVEEATAKTDSKAYNAMNVGKNDNSFFNEVNLENVQESIFFSNISNSESSTSAARMPTMQGELEVARKRKKKTKDKER